MSPLHHHTAVALCALLAMSTASAATYSVTTAVEFNALPALAAGDLVLLRSGTYGALEKTLVSTIADDATALANPILVLAEVPGAADVIAPSRIMLQGRGIVLAGLDFVAGSGMRDNGSSNPAWIVATAADSRHMRISNVRFLDCTAGDDYGHWLYLEGFRHVVEFCSFEGKDEPNRNATVAFKRSTAEAGIATPREHVLRGCYFGPRIASAASGATGNGYETIRIGDSSSQAHDMRVSVEGNVFYRAIWRGDGQKPNDTEIISNKTRGNRIVNNTFLESYGQLTLRHGDACLVEGNFIFGGGVYSGAAIVLNAANAWQGGIRIIGQDHVVRNNYLVNLAGEDLRAALCLMAGAATWTDGDGSGGDNGYEPAHRAEIAHNTFIACREMTLGFVDTGSTQPTGVKIYNNAWQGSGASSGIVRQSVFLPGGSGGNYVYHPSGGASLGWTGLGGTYTSAFSPAIVEDFEGYRIPSATSPLLGAADPALAVTLDVRGLPRPATGRDIGCFEREVAGSGWRPLLRAEVGPVFDGGPAGTYPIPVDPGTGPARVTIAGVTASADDGNVPPNTLDSNLATRWSAQGDGQWIRYDLGALTQVHFLKLAWHNGASRVATFDVEVSTDGASWTPIAAGRQSSGATLALELVEVPDTSARFLRIVGHGNSTSTWNSITETEIWGVLVSIGAAEIRPPSATFTGADLQLTMPTVPGRIYHWQRSDTLAPPAWAPVGSAQLGTGADLLLVDPGAALVPARFYRVLIAP